jgi:hypothetical protein
MGLLLITLTIMDMVPIPMHTVTFCRLIMAQISFSHLNLISLMVHMDKVSTFSLLQVPARTLPLQARTPLVDLKCYMVPLQLQLVG